MGEVVNGKQVFFIGAWKARQFTDQLLKQISGQISSKKGFLTDLRITTEGLELHMYNANGHVTRHDKIALENIVDFIDNKYSTTCTLAIVRDKQQKSYTVFVFICKSDKDAAVLIQLFKNTKGQLSGEGYNFDLTPKGHNWLLQEKSEPKVHKSVNGEIKVFSVNSSQEGNVRVNRTEDIDAGFNMSADTHSRTSVKSSNSEVKEELSQLADEVRGIKRLLEGSRGRAKFENHYGYRILSGKKSHVIPVTTKINEPKENVQPAPVPVSKNGTVVYARSSNHMRYPDGQQKVIVTRGSVPRSTRRYRSDGHVLSVSPTRAAYTKRVYESRNPYADSTDGKIPVQPVQQVRYVTQQPPVLIPRIRSRGSTLSYGSDVVHKSIENVYRSRPSRRVYLPPHPTSPIFPAEAIYTHEVHGSKHPPHAKEIQVQKQVNGHSTVHVKYSPEVRTYYDTNENEIEVKGDNDPNVSTNVNVSVIENLDDKEKQEDKGYVVANVPTIIVQSDNEISRSAPEGEANVHVVRVESNKSITEDQTHSTGGGVYYVKAEQANGLTNDTRNNEDIVVIQSNADEIRSDNITTETRSEQRIHNVVNDTYDVTEDVDVNDDAEETGLFESYVKEPEEYEEQTGDIVVEKAVRYHEDDGDVQVTVIETEQTGVLSADNISEPRDQEDNEGLFGAYTKSPEEFDEPKSTIIAERTFRYHDDERDRTEDDDNESNDNEKHVHYNENVEQIPITGNDVHVDVEERNLRATYEADEPIETTEFGITNGVTDRVQQLNAKTRGDSLTSDKEDDEEEEEYKLDMEALKVYNSAPDIVIIEPNEDRKVESVTRDFDRVSITDDVVEDITDSTTMKDIQRSSLDIQDDVKDIAMSDKVKLPVTDDDLQAFAARKMEGTSIHDDIIDEIKTRGENTVLF